MIDFNKKYSVHRPDCRFFAMLINSGTLFDSKARNKKNNKAKQKQNKTKQKKKTTKKQQKKKRQKQQNKTNQRGACTFIFEKITVGHSLLLFIYFMDLVTRCSLLEMRDRTE